MAKRKVFSIGNSLSEGLEQTIAAAQNYSTKLRIDIIPLAKVEIDPENPRTMLLIPKDLYKGLDSSDVAFEQKNKEKESLQSLSKSILDQGVINPILVYENNGMYRLIAGERRTLASILAGKTDIQAKIMDEKPDELKVRILQWIENIERSDLTLFERLDNLEKILNSYAKKNNILMEDIRITDISHLIGCAKSHAMNLKSVLNADSQIKELIKSNKIRNLEKASIISNIESYKIKQKAIHECLNGATLKRLKEILTEDKNFNNESTLDHIAIKQASIDLGKTTNIKVAQHMIRIILNDNDLNNEFHIDEIDLESPLTLSKTFKHIITFLEQKNE